MPLDMQLWVIFPIMKFVPLFLLLSTPLLAEVPRLDTLFPAGGQIGSTFEITAAGKLDTNVRLWTDVEGLYLVPTEKKGIWQATITQKAPPGLHLVYALNNEGVSTPRWLSIGRYPEMAETEPNDEVATPQIISKLPVCINARLEKRGDIDGFAVPVKAGQTLVAWVEAYSIGSPVDVIAHVINPKGERILTASDSRNLDPQIVHKAETDGTYIIQIAGFQHPPVADVQFTGGANNIYRLHISTGPVVTQLYPAALTSGKTEVELVGYNLDPKKTRQTIEGNQVRLVGIERTISLPDFAQPIQVIHTDKAAQIEKEPNQTFEQATSIQPGTVAGIIENKTDVDRYKISMKKGEKLQVRLYAQQIGLPLDATLRIEDAQGKLLLESIDQATQSDPMLILTAANDGEYQLIVEDQFHQGGPHHSYLLTVEKPQAAYLITLPERKPITLERGKKTSIKLQFKSLLGFKDAAVARVAGLPPGVYAPEVPIPAKGGDVEVTLHAAENAPPATVPITLQVWTTTIPSIQVTADYPLRGEEMRGSSLRDRDSLLWLNLR